jgi:hypothetical protein
MPGVFFAPTTHRIANIMVQLFLYVLDMKIRVRDTARLISIILTAASRARVPKKGEKTF